MGLLEWSECFLWWKRFIWVEDATRTEEPWGSGEIWNRNPSLPFSPFLSFCTFTVSLFLLHPFLPPLWLDPWLWLWAQQPCNPPLPCSKGLSSLRTGPLCEHSSGKKTLLYTSMYMCVCTCLCNKRQNCTNSEWRLTSCISPWLWESVRLTHFSGKLFMPDLHGHPSDTTGKFSYEQEFNEKHPRRVLSLLLPCEGNPWFDFHTGSESPHLLLFKNNPGAAERGRSIWEKSIKSGRVAIARTKPVTRARRRGHFDRPHSQKLLLRLKKSYLKKKKKKKKMASFIYHVFLGELLLPNGRYRVRVPLRVGRWTWSGWSHHHLLLWC